MYCPGNRFGFRDQEVEDLPSDLGDARFYRLRQGEKKRPHFWGHNSKEAMEGKSGKAMQGANPAPGSAECEKSRTESEGQARPLFLPGIEALAAPKNHRLP